MTEFSRPFVNKLPRPPPPKPSSPKKKNDFSPVKYNSDTNVLTNVLKYKFKFNDINDVDVFIIDIVFFVKHFVNVLVKFRFLNWNTNTDKLPVLELVNDINNVNDLNDINDMNDMNDMNEWNDISDISNISDINNVNVFIDHFKGHFANDFVNDLVNFFTGTFCSTGGGGAP